MNGKRKNGNEAVAYEATEIIPVLHPSRGRLERIALDSLNKIAAISISTLSVRLTNYNYPNKEKFYTLRKHTKFLTRQLIKVIYTCT